LAETIALLALMISFVALSIDAMLPGPLPPLVASFAIFGASSIIVVAWTEWGKWKHLVLRSSSNAGS